MRNPSRWLVLLLSSTVSLFSVYHIRHVYKLSSPHITNHIGSYIHEKGFNLTRNTITIQWKTLWFGKDATKTLGGGRGLFSGCPVEECKMIGHTSKEKAGVFLFHSRDVPKFPSTRLPHHKYIFFTRESEIYDRTRPLSYNLTMTYRLDSDIPMPYGAFKKLEKPRRYTKNMDTILGKTKKIAWVVSHCRSNSNRAGYVKELKRHIDIDVYGKCGTLSCDTTECFSMINNIYKFYLAFENSICEDYITEKLYRTMEIGGIIPVVLGGADYSKLVPPHSVINVMDYPSPRALAEYLHKLDRNDTLYYEYFKWRDYYELAPEEFRWCTLCEYLHANRNQTKVYGNIRQWYNATARCRKFNSTIFA